MKCREKRGTGNRSFYKNCKLSNYDLTKTHLEMKGNNGMNQRQIKIGKKYRHFKGNEYLVLHLAKHSETLEEMVVYQALYGEKGIWVRPLEMFLDQREFEGKLINRFEEIEE